MNISFDLDGMLIPNNNEFDVEKRNIIAKLLGIEKLRKGTAELFFELKNEGHKIHIYTTSFRSRIRIRLTLKYYGIEVDKIVNQFENLRVLNSLQINSSKYPKAFDFQVHVDDSIGVSIEGKRLNFKTIIIKPMDINWVERVRCEIENI
jgi:hypothetical protein